MTVDGGSGLCCCADTGGELTTLEADGARNALFEPFYAKHVCQDRLGTKIGHVEEKDTFFAGSHLTHPLQAGGTNF